MNHHKTDDTLALKISFHPLFVVYTYHRTVNTNLRGALKHAMREKVHSSPEISSRTKDMQRYHCHIKRWRGTFAQRTEDYHSFEVLINLITEEGSQGTASQPKPEKQKKTEKTEEQKKTEKTKTRKKNDKGSQEEKEIKTEGLVSMVPMIILKNKMAVI